jgi:hypothetical protein
LGDLKWCNIIFEFVFCARAFAMDPAATFVATSLSPLTLVANDTTVVDASFVLYGHAAAALRDGACVATLFFVCPR